MATVNEKMTAIADAIRHYVPITEKLTLDDMASGIKEVYEVGEGDGRSLGYEEGTETGKLAERNAFWEILTNNGSEQKYFYTFCECVWNKNNFKPTCNIVPTEADHMFNYHNRGGTAYDLAQHLEDLGVVLDLSNCTIGNYTFENAVVSRLPELDMTKGTFTCFVRNCKQLVTIDKIIVSDAGDQPFTQTFNACNVLKNITFEGVIGRSISFPHSPLTVESMKSIISCLKDYSTESPFTYTLTLKDSSKTALQADTETVKFNGEDYTYFELIIAKGWNLA